MQSTPQVLLVDDDALIQGMVGSCLATENLKLLTASEGFKALEMCAHYHFDLILLDLGLPDISGFDLLKRFKTEIRTQNTPVIVLTAWNSTEDKLTGFELGAVDYITKPFELAELRARVRATLKSKLLQDQLAQANRELEESRKSAEHGARVKAEFLANMSHEIRTPMNGVIAMTGLLLESTLNKEQREVVETIRSSGDALLTIINDILDFSKIESGRLELENQPFDLRLCIEDALDLMAPQSNEKNLDLAYQIEGETPPWVIGDVTRLRQILVNLLGNAVKFTPSGEVFVQVRTQMLATQTPYERNDPSKPTNWRYLHFSVVDTGIGIAADKMPKLFKSFSQVDASTTRNFGGTGLGLAISKSLAELMGGMMWVESKVGKGSSFHFTIRVQAAEAPPVDANPELAKSLLDSRLLIVDDNQTNRRVLNLQTRNWGMKPQTVASGPEALDLLRRGEPFDVAILDMQMPEMDGMMLSAAIRQLRSAAQLPLILLTSMGVRSDNPELAHFSSCLTKPVRQAQLRDALSKALNRISQPVRTTSPAGKLDGTLATRLPLHMLLVDDNAINQKVALRLLNQMGYKADVAANGLEAITAVEQKRYDVVFMDIQMPELDGLEATRQLRKMEAGGAFGNRNRLIIIAMTANAMLGDRERCLASGMDDYIPKPVRPEALQTAIEHWGGKALHAVPPIVNLTPPAPPLPKVDNGLPPVDMDRLNEFTSGDPESFRELASLYIKQTSEQLAQLEIALQNGQAGEVKRVAHSCAGASATCGMVAIVPSLRELERMGLEAKLESAAPMLAQAREEYAHIIKFLEKEMSGGVAP